jgi:Xaa-Pro aminopeptidase
MPFGKFESDRGTVVDYPRMREYRLKRVVEQMKKKGVGALVTFDQYEMRYISAVYMTHPVKWMEGQCVMLMDDGTFYVDAGHIFVRSAMPDELPWLKGRMLPRLGTGKTVFVKEGLSLFCKTLAEKMAAHGVSKKPVALSGCTSEFLYGEALKDVGLKAVDGKEIMFESTKIKNQDELACLRIANVIADAAFADIKDAIRPGAKECELVGVGMKRLYSEGCDETMEFVCASGPRTNPLHIDYTDRMLEPGDLVIIDINGASWQGYKTCYYRTFSVGKSTQVQRDNHEVARKMMYDAMGVIKPGVTNRDISRKFPDSPKFWGWDSWSDVGGYAVGHGVGIALHNLPWIRQPAESQPEFQIEEGMVFAVETWYGKKGANRDGVRLEEIVAVTKDGYELLTHWPVDTVTECWL